MKNKPSFILISLFLVLSVFRVSCQVNPDRQWTSYRGKLASGVLDNANLPDTFDFDKNRNIRWRTGSLDWDFPVLSYGTIEYS